MIQDELSHQLEQTRTVHHMFNYRKASPAAPLREVNSAAGDLEGVEEPKRHAPNRAHLWVGVARHEIILDAPILQLIDFVTVCLSGSK